MPIIQANGITINYHFDEPGPNTSSTSTTTTGNNASKEPDTVVLIAGLSDEISTWDPQVPALLAAGFRVLRYDNRGIGASSKPDGPYTASDLASDLDGLLDALGVGAFHLVGMSMGGMVAVEFALRWPNAASSLEEGRGNGRSGRRKMLSLSLCCTYAAPGPFCSRMFSSWRAMATQMGIEAVMRNVTLWCFTVPFFTSRTAELEQFEAGTSGLALLDMKVEHYLSQLHVIEAFDATQRLRALKEEGKILGGLEKGQVMVMVGEEDILIPVQVSKELWRLVGEDVADWVTTRGGHGCQWEFPEETNDTLVSFLKRHGQH